MSYSDDRLRGVGGWLAFLVISLMALGPLRALIVTASDMADAARLNPQLAGSAAWTNVQVVVWLFVALQIAMMIFTGWRLNKVFRRSTVKLAMIMLWVMGPVWNVVTLAALGVATGGNAFGAEALLSVAPSAVYALIWTLYLLLSRRVANTYDEEGPEAQGEAELANVFE